MNRIIVAGFVFASWLATVSQVGPGIAEAADFYVAPDGSDDHPGTEAEPFASLGRARDAVRELIQQGLDRDLRVLIQGGNYTLSEPVAFGPEDSGSDPHSITYAAVPGEHPVFSGGRPIRGWQEDAQGNWTVELPDVKSGKWSFTQLFVNGQRRVPARHPNQGYLRVVAAGPDNRTSFQFQKGDLRSYAGLDHVELVFLHDWSVSRMGIKQVDEQKSMAMLRAAIGARGHDFFSITGFEPHPRFYVEQAGEFLDAPGEWFVDRRTGVLSYRPFPDEELTNVQAVAPVQSTLLVVAGDREQGRPVSNLRFVGLTFTHAASPRFPAGYAGIQAGFHEPRDVGSQRGWRSRMPAAVILRRTSGCELKGCRVLRVGGTAISLEGPASNNAVVGNEITDAGGNGVMVGESSTAPDLLATDNVVRNNRIHRCGLVYHGCVGVWVGITRGTVVEHNEIHDLPYTGVSVGWMWNTQSTPCRENIVQYNHIHHVMQVLSDGGGIYTLGRQPGTVLRGNLIHDIPLNAGRAESNGMFIDEGSSEIVIEHNTIYNTERSPIRFHKATNDVVRHNVLVSSPDTPTFRYNATDPDSMTYEANLTPDSGSWQPPEPSAIKAGLEPEGGSLE